MHSQHVPTSRLAALTLAALVSGGCASAPTDLRVQLPFNVALVPVEIIERDFEGPERKGVAKTGMRLRLHGEQVSELLVQELHQKCFTRSLVLQLPPGASAQEFASLSPAEQEQHWVRAAYEEGADLVICARLRYDPDVYTATNDRFWLNVPLFLLGGPMTWFVDDRSYFVDAKLDTEIFDLNSFRSHPDASLSDANFRVLDEGRVLGEVSLDFIDRAGDSLGFYALSILIPSGFLAKESEGVLAQLQEVIVSRLGIEVVGAIRGQSDKLQDAPVVADFKVLDLALEGDVVSGKVVLAATPRVESMRLVRVSSLDGSSAEYDMGAGSPDGSGRVVYDVRVPVPAGADRSRLRVEFFDEGETTRSFTLDGTPAEALYRR